MPRTQENLLQKVCSGTPTSAAWVVLSCILGGASGFTQGPPHTMTTPECSANLSETPVSRDPDHPAHPVFSRAFHTSYHCLLNPRDMEPDVGHLGISQMKRQKVTGGVWTSQKNPERVSSQRKFYVLSIPGNLAVLYHLPNNQHKNNPTHSFHFAKSQEDEMFGPRSHCR